GAQAPVASEPAKKTEPATKVKDGEKAEGTKKAAEVEIGDLDASGEGTAAQSEEVESTSLVKFIAWAGGGLAALILIAFVVVKVVMTRRRHQQEFDNDGSRREPSEKRKFGRW